MDTNNPDNQQQNLYNQENPSGSQQQMYNPQQNVNMPIPSVNIRPTIITVICVFLFIGAGASALAFFNSLICAPLNLEKNSHVIEDYKRDTNHSSYRFGNERSNRRSVYESLPGPLQRFLENAAEEEDLDISIDDLIKYGRIASIFSLIAGVLLLFSGLDLLNLKKRGMYLYIVYFVLGLAQIIVSLFIIPSIPMENAVYALFGSEAGFIAYTFVSFFLISGTLLVLILSQYKRYV